ncbi:hypothetical protein M885DRAFT_306567 [Pelagophyceae sp. CCMP2097]|nr:hypothetical protein M885DRAFT_306567 [Pelagophyceae sp. CCMP2097]
MGICLYVQAGRARDGAASVCRGCPARCPAVIFARARRRPRGASPAPARRRSRRSPSRWGPYRRCGPFGPRRYSPCPFGPRKTPPARRASPNKVASGRPQVKTASVGVNLEAPSPSIRRSGCADGPGVPTDPGLQTIPPARARDHAADAVAVADGEAVPAVRLAPRRAPKCAPNALRRVPQNADAAAAPPNVHLSRESIAHGLADAHGLVFRGCAWASFPDPHASFPDAVDSRGVV